MEQPRKRRSGLTIALIILLVILILAVAAAAIFLFVPSSKGYAAAESGIGLISNEGDPGWMDGGRDTKLLAIAASRAWKTDGARFSEPVLTLQFTRAGAEAEVQLVRDPATGDLAFHSDGVTRTHLQRYLRLLLDNDAINGVINHAEPDAIRVGGKEVFANSYDFFGTSLYGEPLRFTGSNEGAGATSFEFDSTDFEIEGLPAAARVTISREGNQVYSGSADEYAGFDAENNAEYDYLIEVAYADGSVAEYRFSATFRLEPTITLSSQDLLTGGSLVITVIGVDENTVLSADTPVVDFPVQFSVSGDVATALIPFNYKFEPGDYEITVRADDYTETFPISVTLVEYGRQDLTITGDGAAASNTASIREYNEKVVPLFQSYDPEIYWDGLFIQPVDGTITTDFGIYRYTNGSTTVTSRHGALDIANAEGTEIVAPNGGKVLFADFLEYTGNTILIEHGMGLHTLYMHMESLDVEAGQMVEKGQRLGAIGTTGYSTGPHLHYEMMILDRSISPWFAQDGTAGFYALKPESEAE